MREHLPGTFGHARNCALMREVAQADPAEAELAEDRAGASAAVAAGVLPYLVARLAGGFRDERLLRHYPTPRSSPVNGNPSPLSSARPCSSVVADVVMATSSPRTAAMSS